MGREGVIKGKNKIGVKSIAKGSNHRLKNIAYQNKWANLGFEPTRNGEKIQV